MRPDYLRISITDRCNLRCLYCRPEAQTPFSPYSEVLSYEEIAGIAEAFAACGVRFVRVTGGEPLMRREIWKLVNQLKSIPGIEEVSLTTNGLLLPDLLPALKAAGLDRINISLDTLDRVCFEKITGSKDWDWVLQAILLAIEAGFTPLKVNVVLIPGVNEREIPGFIDFFSRYPVIIRFIEQYPLAGHSKTNPVPVKSLLEARFGKLVPEVFLPGHGPARYYRVGEKGTLIGIINGMTGNFCGACNRLRMDCLGRVFPCLFAGPVADLKPLLNDRKALLKQIDFLMKIKPGYNKSMSGQTGLEMSCLGG